MPSVESAQWGNKYSPTIRLTFNERSRTGNTITYSWILDYITTQLGGVAQTNGIARGWEVNIDGQKRTGSFNINYVRGPARITSGDITVSRTNSNRNITLTGWLYMDVQWHGVYQGWVSASGSTTVPARESHTVSYNANGGSGAPGNQTKWYGDILTLSSTVPSRSGYRFTGWKRGDNGHVVKPGEQYGEDKNLSLIAQWSANGYTVSYDANGGSGAPGNQTKVHDQTLTLSNTRPTKTNYVFKGWGVSSGSTTATYQPGNQYTSNSPITLYAIWELNYTPPRITNVKIDRCNSSGVLTESGTYAKVEFKFSCDRSVKNIKISSRVSNSGNFADNATFTDSRLEANISKVVGGSFSVETTYDIQITVSDSVGSSSTIQGLAPMSFAIDVRKGGKGVAIGGPSNSNLFEVYMPTKLTGGLDVPVIPHKSNLNNYKTPGFYRTTYDGDSNGGANSIANRPTNGAFSLIVEKSRDDGGAAVRQTLSPYHTTETYVRRCHNNSWTTWVRHVDSDTFNGYFDGRMNSVFNGKFDSRFNEKLKTVYNKNIALGYGLQGKLVKRGNTVTISVWRQIVNWGGSGEFKLLAETIPNDIKPVEEVNLILTKNAGSFNPPPMTIHIQKDGHMYYTNFNPGTWVHCGTVTYQLV